MTSRGAIVRSLLLAGVCLAGGGCALFRSPERNKADDAPYGVRRASYEDAETAEKEIQAKARRDQALGALSPDQLLLSAKKAVGQGPDRNLARDLYAQANSAYEQARQLDGEPRVDKFLEAAKLYQKAAVRWPDSALEQDSIFMSAESYFFADHYPTANGEYEKLVKKYPNSRHGEQAQARRFTIAQFWLEWQERERLAWYNPNMTDNQRPTFDTGGHAHRLFDKIRIDDPSGRLADDATLAAANAHFRQKRFTKADEYYSDLRRAFPDSEHQWPAHYLGLKAKLLSYMGSDYEGTSLDEAENLVKQMRRLFPDKADDEREYLDRAYSEIRYKQGEKMWKKASFHDSRGEYRAARYYWERASEEFDDTPFGGRARERMRDTASKPDMPKMPLAWLSRLFPDDDEFQPILDKALIPPEERRKKSDTAEVAEAAKSDEAPRVGRLSPE